MTTRKTAYRYTPLQMERDVGSRNVIVNVSGGAGSTIALIRCLNLFKTVIPVFADTNFESPSLYRLLDQIEKKLSIKIIRLNNGVNTYEVFDSYIKDFVSGACKASVELKRIPLKNFTEKIGKPEEVVIATGLNFDEPDRQERLTKALLPYQTIYPLNLLPRLSSCDLLSELTKLGFNLPEPYTDGYAHNNCNSCCVLAGISHWAKLYKDHPQRFLERAEWEKGFIEKYNFSILKDRRGGTSKPYPLYQLAKDIDNGIVIPSESLSGCNCVVPSAIEQ